MTHTPEEIAAKVAEFRKPCPTCGHAPRSLTDPDLVEAVQRALERGDLEVALDGTLAVRAHLQKDHPNG